MALLRFRNSSDPFVEAVRATKMPITVSDARRRDNPIVFANDAFLNLTGYAVDEVIGRNCRFLQGARTDPGAVERIRAAMAKGEAVETDLLNYRKDGSAFWNRLLIAPVREPAGAITHFIANQVDVTLEREAMPNLASANAALAITVADRTRELAASEERLRQLANTVRDVFYAVDARTGRVDYVSAAFERVWGLPEASLYEDAKTFLAAVHSDDRDRVAAVIAAQAIDGEPTEQRYRLQRPDHTTRRIWDRAWPLRDASGTVYRIVGVAEDETERVMVEERLARREAELSRLNETLEAQVAERTAERDRIWRNSMDMLLLVGWDGAIRATNPAWGAIVGYSAEELAGRPFTDFVHPADIAPAAEAMAMLRHGSIPRLENRLRHKDGSWRSISWSTAGFGDTVYGVGRDVTEERRQAETLAQTEAALRQSQKMEAVGQLTGGIAHDFNNMLQGVASGLELMQRRIDQGRPDEAVRYVEAARRGVERAAQLTQRLLAFGRRQPLMPKRIDLNHLVGGMDDLIRQTVGPSVVVELRLADESWPVRCDANQMENALLNLTINARDAMPGGGRLTIATARAALADADVVAWDGAKPGDYVRLTVEDTGSGMTADVLTQAFEPFFTTKPIGQGSGLGLSQIYGFVRQSGGVARLESELGRGTRVHLFMRRDNSALNGAGVTAPAVAPSAIATPEQALDARVLLVEDEAAVLGLAADALRDLGCRVLEAADGSAGLLALQRAAAGEPASAVDLLVTDVGLPDGPNGQQLAEAARALIPGLPVLLITGYAVTGTGADRSPGAGIEVLLKPFTLAALTAQVRSMLQTTRSDQQPN